MQGTTNNGTQRGTQTHSEEIRDSATLEAEAIRRAKGPNWKRDFVAAVKVMENASRESAIPGKVAAPLHGFYCPVRCWCDKADR